MRRTNLRPRGAARLLHLGLAAALVAGGLALGAATPAGAGEYEVTSGADSGPGTLRQALADAADDTDAVEITFAPNLVVELASSLTYEGDQSLTLTGPATIDGNGVNQALVALDAPSVSLGSLTVRDAGGAGGAAVEVGAAEVRVGFSSFSGNSSAGDGGAISAGEGGNVSVYQSTFSNNHSDGDGGAVALAGTGIFDSSGSSYVENDADGSGGAVAAAILSSRSDRYRGNEAGEDGGAASATTVSLRASTLTGNHADGAGGALHLVLTDTFESDASGNTFQDNSAELGGAIAFELDGVPTIIGFDRNTFVGNEAATGGAIHGTGANEGDGVLLRDSTFTENEASVAGGALGGSSTFGFALMRSTLVANRAPSGAQVSSSVLGAYFTVLAQPLGGANCAVTTGGSRNSRDSGTSCRFAEGGDDIASVQNAADPRLTVLRQTGGPTPTMVPAANSPLLDQYAGEGCTSEQDQRGFPRPSGTGCDIGAAERQTNNTFGDVTDGAAFYGDIEWMAAEGISTGTPASPKPLYKPSASVSRMAMSAFLYRLADEPEFDPPTDDPTFADVGASHPFFHEIEWMAAEGISTGTPGSPKPTFKPAAAVSRAAMSAFLYRLAGGLTGPFTPPSSPTFTDVSTGHPFFTEIEWMAAAGISEGYQPGPTYKPASPVSRQAMSAFLHRLA